MKEFCFQKYMDFEKEDIIIDVLLCFEIREGIKL